MTGPDPNKVYPNENIRQVVFIKNVVKRANIVVGDYTYYDDPDGGSLARVAANTCRLQMTSQRAQELVDLKPPR